MEQLTSGEASKNNFSYRPLATIELPDSWQNILWREKHHCGDAEYTQHLARLIAQTPTSWSLGLQGRPVATEVEVALQQAGQAVSQTSTLWTDLLDTLAQKQQVPDSINKLIADLRYSNWKNRFIARHTLVAVGGEAVSELAAMAANRRNPLQPTAVWLLRSIEFETTARLFPKAAYLLCPRCLLRRCCAHWTELPGQLPLVYYGCQTCGQSREFWEGETVAVLDVEMISEPFCQAGALRANWLARRSLFDFDSVEVVRATDEDIERFAVQVGNDTDELRQPRYEQMRCLIGPECHPSKNTIRILQSQFGLVEQVGK